MKKLPRLYLMYILVGMVTGFLLGLVSSSALVVLRPGAPAPTRIPPPRASAPLAAGMFWASDSGLGGIGQWNVGDGGGIFNSGTGTVTLASNISHDGHPAINLTITNAAGHEQAARIFRWKENPVEAYYGVWLYFPQQYHPANWWNVFQFKSAGDVSDPLWVLNVGNLPNGGMKFYLWDAIHVKSYTRQIAEPEKTIPAGCWTHVEAFYRRATNNTGQITVWQDGIKIFDVAGIQTAVSDYSQWGLANYTDQISPSTATIYAADATVSSFRVGPGNGTQC